MATEHDIDRAIAYEKVGYLISAGLIALALASCYTEPPKDARAYYDSFSDTITYRETPEPSTVVHEETHQDRAHNFPLGRYTWGYLYSINKEFACTEEVWASEAAEQGPPFEHSSCESFTKEEIQEIFEKVEREAEIGDTIYLDD